MRTKCSKAVESPNQCCIS